jgi:hypothetical protein
VGGGNGWLDQHFSQPFAVKTIGMFFHLYYISVSRYIGIILVFKDLKIEKNVKFDPTGSGFDSRGMKLSNPGDLMYYVDAS